MTGAYSRRAIIRILEAQAKGAVFSGDWLTVALLDVDHFKRFNDTFGHLVGDEVLKHICRTGEGALRENDCFGRFGGEEFLIVIRHGDSTLGEDVAERVRGAIENKAYTKGESCFPVTVSIGVASFFLHTSTIDQVLNEADKALYRAKRDGRNRVESVCLDVDFL